MLSGQLSKILSIQNSLQLKTPIILVLNNNELSGNLVEFFHQFFLVSSRTNFNFKFISFFKELYNLLINIKSDINEKNYVTFIFYIKTNCYLRDMINEDIRKKI